MLVGQIEGPRAWRADTIDAPERWRLRLSERCLDLLSDSLALIQKSAGPVTAARLEDLPCRGCAGELAPALAALEQGRGFVILEGVGPERFGPPEQTAAYWLVGQMLGRPFEQNVQGTLLYDVKDTGQDVRAGARFSVTNYESTFHTDNSFGETVLDYVGLLCLATAKQGGRSQVVSVYTLHNELRSSDPEALACLYQPFHVDRRGGVRPGEPATIRVPVLAARKDELLCRYLRYWIEVGQEKAGQPLSPAQKAALDAFDQAAARKDLLVEFDLRPGDMYFINNRWILHNRTAFEDYPEPERKRHLVRLWLARR